MTAESALVVGGARFKPPSIRILLTAASLLFLTLVIGLGSFSLQRLNDVNRVSDEIRNQWLEDIRLLGDLNNYMSDYRTEEATYLLSRNRTESQASDSELAELDGRLGRAQHAFESLPHEASEQRLYAKFSSQWIAYQRIAAHVLELSRTNDSVGAISLYMTESHHLFDLASDSLGGLTVQTVAKASDASARAANAYIQDRRLIVTAMVIASGLVLMTIVYINRSVSLPLSNLARSMNALAAHDTAVDIRGTQRGDEIGEMARSVAVFRENAVALVKSQHQLLEQTVALEETLENERRVTAQQRNFVTLTSHEFRTPLTVIDAQAQRLIKLKDRMSPGDLLHRATRIRSAVTRLTGIMDSLLGASRLLDGQAVFHPNPMEPSALLHEVCQLHRETSRGAEIRENFSAAPAVIEGDSKLLFVLFSNLLSNAIKYSAVGSPVDFIAGTGANGELIVSIRDRGIGIPGHDRARLFERYFRGTNAVSISGSGVGLHLVAMVLELHGGIIEVDSRENGGSTFVVRLPPAALAGQAASKSVL